MNEIFIDSCVLLDLFTNDPNWTEWLENLTIHSYRCFVAMEYQSRLTETKFYLIY